MKMCGHDGQMLKNADGLKTVRLKKNIKIFKDLQIMTHPSTPLLLVLAGGGLLFSASWCWIKTQKFNKRYLDHTSYTIKNVKQMCLFLILFPQISFDKNSIYF